jgi:hypothetical protein
MSWNSGPMLSDDWTPPPRSLHVRAATPEESPDGGLVATCDCGTCTVLTFDPRDPATGQPLPPGSPVTVPGQEVAYTCDGCGSVHWLTLTGSEAP